MNFKELEEHKEYLIRLEAPYRNDTIDRISIETKGDSSCLLVVYNENDNSTYKKWIEYNGGNFYKLLEDLTPITRDRLLSDIINE
jgi:hypothetical protein